MLSINRKGSVYKISNENQQLGAISTPSRSKRVCFEAILCVLGKHDNTVRFVLLS
jgi:hypothetical protein